MCVVAVVESPAAETKPSLYWLGVCVYGAGSGGAAMGKLGWRVDLGLQPRKGVFSVWPGRPDAGQGTRAGTNLGGTRSLSAYSAGSWGEKQQYPGSEAAAAKPDRLRDRCPLLPLR